MPKENNKKINVCIFIKIREGRVYEVADENFF
jgi:hypothetical protein